MPAKRSESTPVISTSPAVVMVSPADALWCDPRFIEIRRVRAAVAAQMADRRFDICADLHHKPRSPDEVEAKLKRARQRRYARKRARNAQLRKAAAAGRAAV
jgi:hypothetical protein